MAGPLRNEDEPIADINVVPLVDIILVVLIIFMVTAPLVLKPSIDVNLPQASSGEVSGEKKNLEVVISKNGEVYLNGEKIDIEQLKLQIEEAAKSAESSVILASAKDATLEGLTSVIDTIKKSGIKKLGFSIQKK